MWPTESLLKTELWQAPQVSELGELSYLRAESISKAYGLNLKDIATLTPKFWKLHQDPILCIDGAATTLLTIHYNLCLGTLSTYLPHRNDLYPLAQSLAEYQTIGQFCLTEVNHGLDAFNLGTTATLHADGSFDLHCPTAANAKYMPPTIPVLSRPCVAIVFAQLVVDGEKRGIRPFVVTLNDGKSMSKGISAQLVPTRHGAAPVNHAITRFEHVTLPSAALLGDLEKSDSPHQDFLQAIWRVGVGTLSLSVITIPLLQIATLIAFKYSVRRKIGAPDGAPLPIISFRTQQMPIFHAAAQVYVLQALSKHIVLRFADTTADHRVRHAAATIFKAATMRQCQTLHLELSERCGAQGLFAYNQIVSQLSDFRGMTIAEGDILVLSIRLATELLVGKYSLLPAADPESLLAKHETSLFDEYREIARKYGHRSKAFASLVLPRCLSLVEAVGARMAYEAALAEGVPKPLVDLYVTHTIREDLSWYVEAGMLTRASHMEKENDAFEAAFPVMGGYINGMGAAPFVRAPIVSDAKWEQFLKTLRVFKPPVSGAVRL
ncbi:acyl-CoA oxidase [Rhodofomes roseus]|uniref:Acyl-CoA oxidase n=1 Tax=Rhodofomes roseus TaxID=34475 RepID=A0ABQ8K6B5_9APHY|nr:acyl-CoA oxidase [Rhodofomes roseus]KAH9832614.1 acyl-CoA oxidase [Rhodofomes roseus]